MTKEDEIKNEITVGVTNGVPADASSVSSAAPSGPADISKSVEPGKKRGGFGREGRMRGRGGRPGRRGGFERVKPEFDQKMIDIRRVTRVVAGGRRFSFSVVLIIGDRKGAVGVGTGKAGDTSLAIDKAFRDARKNLLRPNLTKSMSIPHEVTAKYSSAEIKLIPNKGKGLVVGSSARIALELAGVKDVTAKVLSGSKNKLNIAMATMKALRGLFPPREKKIKEEAKEMEEKKE